MPPSKLSSCPPKASLKARPLLPVGEAERVAGIFEVLASGTRLRLLHALVLLEDPCLTDLAEAVAMKPQAVSNQLRRMVDLGVLATRRHGSHVHYRVVDACLTKLLHHGLCLSEETHVLRHVSAG